MTEHSRRAPTATIAAWSELVPVGAHVLDVAAGAGRHAWWFAQRDCTVTAIDRDAMALCLAAAQLAAAGTTPGSIEPLAADLENAPWPLPGRTFDAIVVVDYLWRPLLPTLAASLAPGGLLLYETFAVGQERFGRPRNPDFLLLDGELRAFANEHGLDLLDYGSGVVGDPPRSMRQRLLARQRLTDAPAPARRAAP